MNQVTNEQKNQVMKTLAIVGFIAVIIFGVWLAVRIVSYMPNAFSSLASIADVVYNYKDTPQTLTVTNKDKTIDSGNLSNITWNDIALDGTYTFSYVCTDGVSVDVRTTSGMTTATCGESITLGGKKTNTDIIINSEKKSSVEVNYTIAFIKKGDVKPLVSTDNVISVTNPNLSGNTENITLDTTNTTSDNSVSDQTNATDNVQANNQTNKVKTSTPKPNPVVIPPTPIKTVVYKTPVSNPDGFVDLAIRIIAVGHLDSAGNFVKGKNIDNDTEGAYKFEVKNIGTKTSDNWSFDAKLTSGTTYTAPTQPPLKPQERVEFTLGYDNVGAKGIQTIGVTIKAPDDANSKNNIFAWAVSVVE